ncbi:MAG: hypothetical protein ABSH06_19175, partial [Thermodesulfobacteriota bacterium]
PSSLAYLRMASRFPPFTRDTPRYHKTRHIAILIWNHTTRYTETVGQRGRQRVTEVNRPNGSVFISIRFETNPL